ncbi:MAG: tetratricopeptide repeat protein [Gemmatimonadaceae bacterium]
MTPQQLIETEGWSFGDWIQANTRAITIGLAVVLVGGAGYWYYLRSSEIKRLNAERGLNQAKQALSAGNAALAKTDLGRVATRYKGTAAGAQAAMILAQIQFDEGKVPDGLNTLAPYQSAGSAGPNLASVWALTGDGQLAAGKAEDAATAYEKAAEATELKGERAVYLAKQARVLMTAGKNAESKAIWERLVNDPDATVVRNEAEIRLGELNAQPAGKS